MADIEASEAATRRAVSGITYGKASISHQEMRATELTGQKAALNNRLKALESLRANLERALQPPSRGRTCSKITVETTFPMVALQEAIDSGLQQRVMGVLLTPSSKAQSPKSQSPRHSVMKKRVVLMQKRVVPMLLTKNPEPIPHIPYPRNHTAEPRPQIRGPVTLAFYLIFLTQYALGTV